MAGVVYRKKKSYIKLLIIMITLLILLGGCSSIPPEGVVDANEIVQGLTNEFWRSSIVEDALLSALYPDTTKNLKQYNELNVLNVKMKLATYMHSNIETIKQNGKTAKVSITVDALDFLKYYDEYCREKEEITELVNSYEVLDDYTALQIDFKLRNYPHEILDREGTEYHEKSLVFTLKYKDGEWVIKRPKPTEELFLELYVPGIEKVVKGKYNPK